MDNSKPKRKRTKVKVLPKSAEEAKLKLNDIWMGILQTTSAFAYEMMQTELGEDCGNKRSRLNMTKKQMKKLQEVMDKYLLDNFDKLEEQYGTYRSSLQGKDKNSDPVQSVGCTKGPDNTVEGSQEKKHRVLSFIHRRKRMANEDNRSSQEDHNN